MDGVLCEKMTCLHSEIREYLENEAKTLDNVTKSLHPFQRNCYLLNIRNKCCLLLMDDDCFFNVFMNYISILNADGRSITASGSIFWAQTP